MIETARLFLRPIELGDFDDHLAMEVDPENDFPSRQGLTEEESWKRMLRKAGHWALLDYGSFVVLDKSSKCYLGETGLQLSRRSIGEDVSGLDEAAWYFTKGAHGHGYALEAACAVHDWYVKRTGRRRTFCMIHPDNSPSLTLARRLGYHPLRNAIYNDDPVIILDRTAN